MQAWPDIRHHAKHLMAGGQKSTWYVSFEQRKSAPDGKRIPPRATETFANEAEAKKFAKAKCAEGLHVTAGTINPHLPKRVLASTQIDAWCAKS
jgi:hypothetical protein